MSETKQPEVKVWTNGSDRDDLPFKETFSFIRENVDKASNKFLGKYSNKWTKAALLATSAAIFYQIYQYGASMDGKLGGIVAAIGIAGVAATGTVVLAYANSDKMKERLNYAKKNTIGRAADLVKRFGETRKELSQPEWTVEGDGKVAHHEPGMKPTFWQVVQKMRGGKGPK